MEKMDCRVGKEVIDRAHPIGRVTMDKHGKPSQQVIVRFKAFPSVQQSIGVGRKLEEEFE